MVQVRITSEIGSNHAGVEYPFGESIDVTDRLTGLATQKDRELAIINTILPKQREHALDHEQGNVRFHGAALVKTKQGRWILQANIHVHNSSISRNCAEANAITEARGHEGKNLQIAEIWVMGGRANYEAGKEFLGNEGQRIAPCGSCMDAIYKNRTRIGADTIVHMVPLNDGTMKLLPGDPDDKRPMDDIEPNRVFSRRIRDLLPNLTYQMGDHDGSRKSMISKGYEWMHNPGAWKAIGSAVQQQQLVDLQKHEKNLSPHKRMEEINGLLMETAKDYIQKAKVKPASVTIAIVRAQDGSYYMGKHVNDGITPSSPSAEFSALNAMIDVSPNNRYTDLFLVHLDRKEVAILNDPLGKTDDITVKMPDGATRELLKKYAPQNGDANKIRDFFNNKMDKSGGNVHVFLVNDPQTKEFDPRKHIISTNIKELLPYAFQNPKAESPPARN